jgi:hypothetical protein
MLTDTPAHTPGNIPDGSCAPSFFQVLSEFNDIINEKGLAEAIKAIDTTSMQRDGFSEITLQLENMSLEQFINRKMIQDAVVDNIVDLPTNTMKDSSEPEFQLKLGNFVTTMDGAGTAMFAAAGQFDEKVAQQCLDVCRIFRTVQTSFPTHPKTPILLEEALKRLTDASCKSDIVCRALQVYPAGKLALANATNELVRRSEDKFADLQADKGDDSLPPGSGGLSGFKDVDTVAKAKDFWSNCNFAMHKYVESVNLWSAPRLAESTIRVKTFELKLGFGLMHCELLLNLHVADQLYPFVVADLPVERESFDQDAILQATDLLRRTEVCHRDLREMIESHLNTVIESFRNFVDFISKKCVDREGMQVPVETIVLFAKEELKVRLTSLQTLVQANRNLLLLLLSKPKSIHDDIVEQEEYIKLLEEDPIIANNLPRPNFQLIIDFCIAKQSFEDGSTVKFNHHSWDESYFASGVPMASHAEMFKVLWNFPIHSKLAIRVYEEYLTDRIEGCLEALHKTLLLQDLQHPDVAKLPTVAPDKMYYSLTKADPHNLRKEIVMKLEPVKGSKEKENPALAFKAFEDSVQMPAFRTCQTLLSLIPTTRITLGSFQVSDGTGMKAADAIRLLQVYAETRGFLGRLGLFQSVIMDLETPLPFVRSLDDACSVELARTAAKIHEQSVMLTDESMQSIENNETHMLLHGVAMLRIWTEGAKIFTKAASVHLKRLWGSGLQACSVTINDCPRCDMYVTEEAYDEPTIMNQCLTKHKIEYTEKHVRILGVALSRVEKLSGILGVTEPRDDKILGFDYKEAQMKFAYGKRIQAIIKALQMIIIHGSKQSSKGESGGAAKVLEYIANLGVNVPTILVKQLVEMKDAAPEGCKTTKPKAIKDTNPEVPMKPVPLAEQIAAGASASMASPARSAGATAKAKGIPPHSSARHRFGIKYCIGSKGGLSS